MMVALLLMLADPITFTPGQQVWFGWDHSQTNLIFRLMTNSARAYEFPPSTISITPGPTNEFRAAFPGFPFPGDFNLTARAADAESESDESTPPISIKVVEMAALAPAPTITIATADPFKCTFQGATNAIYRVEGTADFSGWTNLGPATEDPPTSGKFYFLDIEKRLTFFYRIVSP